MPLWEGTKRDIAIVRGIAEVAGPTGKIMIDANNAYNLNLTKEVLAALTDVNLYWLEEAFHEDEGLYEDLKEWLRQRGQNVLIADGGRACLTASRGVGDSRMCRCAAVRYHLAGFHALDGIRRKAGCPWFAVNDFDQKCLQVGYNSEIVWR